VSFIARSRRDGRSSCHERNDEIAKLNHPDKAHYNLRLMAFRPVRDYAIGPLIVAAVLLGWLLALALLLYVATQK